MKAKPRKSACHRKFDGDMSLRQRRRPGQIIEKFDVTDKGGEVHHVVFRYPRMGDVDQLLRFINGAIREAEFLRLNKPNTRTEEKKWLHGMLQGIRKSNKIYITAEMDGVISGGCSIEKSFGASSHVAELGIILREKYTNMGIGSRLMEASMNESLRMGVEVVKLSQFEGNERARHVYEKMGFIHAGVVPMARKNRNGSYKSEAIMYKILV